MVAIDSASTRALSVTYWASSSTTRVESSRSSDVLGENQRSIERFIRLKLNRNMHTAGVSAMSTAPSTMRVRRRAPQRTAGLAHVKFQDVAQQQHQQQPEEEGIPAPSGR
jgi:hypothetical protein